MRCIDGRGADRIGTPTRARHATLCALATLLASCSAPQSPPAAPVPAPAPVAPAAPAPAPAALPPLPTPPAVAPAAARPAVPAARTVPLPPMARAQTWDEFRRLAARRLVEASPHATYLGRVPEPLLAIPVLEVELNRDGTVRRIDVLRRPGQAHDTVQLAIDAVHRAAPFSDVSRLPRPWRYTEVFLFDDQRRFKPRTLDQP